MDAMNFDDAQTVLTELTSMLIAQQWGAENRVKIQRLFNGETPYTAEEARAENIRTNANFLEATRIASNATNQINNAFFKPGTYFKVSLDKGPVNKRSLWSTIITKYINKELKGCRLYRSARESAHAQVVLHGPGCLVWRDRKCPVPEDIGIEDVLLPAGTYCSMKNLDRFALHREVTWGELYDATKGKNSDPNWNKDYVNALLAALFDKGLQPTYQGNRWLFPEKLAEDIKEGMATTASASLAKVMLWDFFSRNKESGKWDRKTVVDYGSVSTENFSESKSNAIKTKDFLYEKDNYADSWQEICHWYLGNCSNVAPYRYYSIRSVGFLLYGPCLTSNKVECRLIDHMMQTLLTLFKNVSDDNREKLQMIDLQNFGVMPDGVSMVPANERHVADWQLITTVRNQMRELMSESASSFVPDATGGESGPAMTATETLVRQNTAVSLTSAVLNQLADQSVYEYREICRRFCIKDNPDPMAKRFRENIKKEGVPLDMLDIEFWIILPEQTVGGGNKSVELNITQALAQEFLPSVGPDGQRIIMRRRYLALTDNPDEAMLVIPDPPSPPSNDVQYSQGVFPTLMMGLPIQVAEGVNLVTYTAMLLTMADTILNQAKQLMQNPDSVAIVAERIAGVANVGTHCEEQIQKIAQNKQMEQKAKLLFKQLSQMMGMVQQMSKAVMAQEQQQAAQGGIDPETQAKIQQQMLLAQTQAKIQDENANQKRMHKQVQWQEENQRKNATVQADIGRKGLQTQADVAAKDLTTHAEIIREANRPQPVNGE